MKLLNLELENFRSFYGEHSLDFSQFGVGLHFVSGRNEHLASLEGNGAGKSSLFEAVHWCLFGKTLRGGSATAAITSWGERRTRVAVALEIRGETLQITRCRGGKGSIVVVRGDGTKREVTQVEVDALVGMPAVLFGPAFIRGQFSSMFFESTPAEQLATMTDILRLNRWHGLSRDCRAKASGIKERIIADEAKLAHNAESVRDTEANFSVAESTMKDWKREHNKEVAKAKKELAKAEAKADNIYKALVSIQKRRKEARRKADTAEHKFDKARRELDNVADKLDDANKERANLKSRVQQLDQDVSNVRSLSGATCPACFQKVGEGNVKQLAEHQTAERRKCRVAVRKLDASISGLEERKKRSEVEVDALRKKFVALNMKVVELSDKRHDLQGDEREVDANIVSKRDFVKHLEGAKNPHKTVVKQYRETLERLARAKRRASQNLKRERAELAAAEFWVDGFRDLRLFVVESALDVLEVEVNNNLSAFGMSDMRVEFACERENESGVVSNKFDVMVTSDHSPSPVPWTAWSGGEYQRLRLACELGISNLILEQNGVDASWEVWDEPTTHLSRRGVMDLMENLRSRAIEKGRSIFVIDHVAVDFPFDSTTTVVKCGQSSEIIVK